MAQIDTLILGQGLAGSLLAWYLSQGGHRVVVVDDGHGCAASCAALGLLTPVAGQRLVKVPYVEDHLAATQRLYRSLEGFFEHPFYFEKEVVRLFQSEREQAIWEQRKREPAYQAYLGERKPPGSRDRHLADPLGSFEIRCAGYLDIGPLLDTLQHHLWATGRLIKASLAYHDLRLLKGSVNWNGLRAHRLIFCEGYGLRHNPWFSWLPLRPVKGESLTLRTTAEIPEQVISCGKTLLPLGAGLFKLGSTYSRDRFDESPTQAGQAELWAALNKLLNNPPSSGGVDYRAGVRPGTRDNFPFIGLHPERPQLGVLNGFGSKGALMLPLYIERFAELLEGGLALPGEVDIRRYWSPHSPSGQQ